MCAVAGMVNGRLLDCNRGEWKKREKTANKHIYEIYVDCLKSFSRYAYHIRTANRRRKRLGQSILWWRAENKFDSGRPIPWVGRWGECWGVQTEETGTNSEVTFLSHLVCFFLNISIWQCAVHPLGKFPTQEKQTSWREMECKKKKNDLRTKPAKNKEGFFQTIHRIQRAWWGEGTPPIWFHAFDSLSMRKNNWSRPPLKKKRGKKSSTVLPKRVTLCWSASEG